MTLTCHYLFSEVECDLEALTALLEDSDEDLECNQKEDAVKTNGRDCLRSRERQSYVLQ